MAEEEGAQSAAFTQHKMEPVCDECKENPSKYKCPGCSVRSCSLSCVKSHKLRTSCSGKRDKTQFVPLSKFNDNLLLSDFNLLEDVKRVAETAQRTRVKLCGKFNFNLPPHLRGLQSLAARKRTRLWFLPNGMLRRERNKTRYNRKKNSISWTIEWRFNSTDAVLLEHGIHDHMILRTVIEKHFKPSPWRHKLRKFSDEQLESLKFFICKYPKGSRSAFRELDINAPVSHLFSHLTILEYPVIYVYLPSDTYDFEVVRDLQPYIVKEQQKPRETENLPIQSDGIHFKEEEIAEEEDGSFPETQVLDLKNDVSPPQLHSQNTKLKIEDNNSTEDDNTHVLEEVEDQLKFDQELIDQCSLLFQDYNPDEFFDFEMGLGPVDDVVGEAAFSMELEEGEIPDSQ